MYGKFVVEDWSGIELAGPSAGFASKEPQFLNDADGDVVGQIPTSGPHAGSLCFSVHVSSLKPGLAVIKLAVREDLLRLLPGLDVLAKHQFLVIWMRSNAPAIREVANADFPSISVGDPLGDGIFNLGHAERLEPRPGRGRRDGYGADGQQLLRHLPEQRGHPADRLAGTG